MWACKFPEMYYLAYERSHGHTSKSHSLLLLGWSFTFTLRYLNTIEVDIDLAIPVSISFKRTHTSFWLVGYCPPPCVMCLERCGAPCLQNFVWCRRSGNLLQQTKDVVQICLMDHQWSCTPHPRSEQYPRSLLLAAAQLENVSRQKHSTSYTSKGLKSSPQ